MKKSSVRQSVNQSQSQLVSNSVTHSLSHSAPQSLSVTQSLNHSVAQSLSRSVAQSLSRSVAQSLSRSVAQSLSRSVSSVNQSAFTQPLRHRPYLCFVFSTHRLFTLSTFGRKPCKVHPMSISQMVTQSQNSHIKDHKPTFVFVVIVIISSNGFPFLFP